MTFREEQQLAMSILGHRVRATSHSGNRRSYEFIVYDTVTQLAHDSGYSNDRIQLLIWYRTGSSRLWTQSDIWIGHYTYEVLDA